MFVSFFSVDVLKFQSKIKKEILKQPIICVGTLGHVAHGKTALIKSLTGVNVIRFQKEKLRNISIKLGYTNCSILKCKNINHKYYYSFSSSVLRKTCKICKKKNNKIFHFSFIDCPGHHLLLNTTLTGISVMDLTLFVISCNEKFPQAQTLKHLLGYEILNFSEIIIAHTKIDTVEIVSIFYQYLKIKTFFKKKYKKLVEIIPTSIYSPLGYSHILNYLIKNVQLRPKTLEKPLLLIVIRTFNINKHKIDMDEINGGILGGTIIKGSLRVGQIIEIKPVIIDSKKNTAESLFTKVKEIKDEKITLQKIYPGGLLAVKTQIDPFLTTADNMVGCIAGEPNFLPNLCKVMSIKYYNLSDEYNKIIHKEINHFHFFPKNSILLTINTANVICSITNVNCKYMIVNLRNSTYFLNKQKVTISKKINHKWVLLAWGEILNGY